MLKERDGIYLAFAKIPGKEGAKRERWVSGVAVLGGGYGGGGEGRVPWAQS